MTWIQVVGLTLALVVGLPVVAYLTAKAVSFGWRRGAQLAEDWLEERAPEDLD